MMNFLANEVFLSDKFIRYIAITLGFFAQILFSSRMIIQWISAEKNKKVTSDLIFWQVSLLASIFMFIHGFLLHDFSIMLGQLITYYIYIRNIQLHNAWEKYPITLRYFIYSLPVIVIGLGVFNNAFDINKLFKQDPVWLIIWGSFGQILFTMRFVYQWIYSERIKKSELPMGFWLLSLTGSLMIFTYAIITLNPVLIAGQGVGIIAYSRNIIILKKNHVV